MIERRVFGKADGKEVYAYTLEEGYLRVTVIDLGASIQSIKFKGRELTLGYDNLDDYLKRRSYFGATIGRVANRVGGGKYTLGGKVFTLDKNDGQNSLHGGFNGFDTKIFESRADEDGVTFSLLSPDGDGGYGGTLLLEVRYFLWDGALNIVFKATSHSDTVWNPTNHTFFNLSGTNEPIYDTQLVINAEKFLPVDKNLIPTGEERSVEGTPYDFTAKKPIGRDISCGYEQLEFANGGYDQCFILRGNPCAVAEYDGVRLEVYTDMPGLQLYTGNFLDGEQCRGKIYGKHTAFCLEAQYFPDAVNNNKFQAPLLRAGEIKNHYIKYKFV